MHRQAALTHQVVASEVDMLTTLSQRLEVWTVLDNFCEDFIRNLWDVRRVRHAIIDNARSNSTQAIFYFEDHGRPATIRS